MNYNNKNITSFLKSERENFGEIKNHKDRVLFSEYLSRSYKKEELKIFVDDLKTIPQTWNFLSSSMNSIITLFVTLSFGVIVVALSYYYNLSFELLTSGQKAPTDNLLETLIGGIGVICLVLLVFAVYVQFKITKAAYYLSICEHALEKDLFHSNDQSIIQPLETT